MPYRSDAQRRYFHAAEQRGDISPKAVREFDRSSKNKKLPEKVKTKKAQPGGSDVHIPQGINNPDEKKKPVVPGAANPSQAERKVVPTTPPAKAKATNRSEGVIPPEIANLEVQVIKAGYGVYGADVGGDAQLGDNADVGIYDMQQIVAGIDWEMQTNKDIDEDMAKERALANLEDDPMYYKKRWMEADNTDDQLALTNTSNGPTKYQKDTEQNDEQATSDWPEGINLDLASGSVRKPGYVGVDLYPHDLGTYVHDLTLGIPIEDGMASNIRLVNGLQYIDGYNEDPKPLLAEIQRALAPGGQFVYEGPNELYNFPKWVQEGGIDGMQLMNEEEMDDPYEDVEKVEGRPRPWIRQTYRRIAVPDAATANDAEPRIGIAQYDMLPADALLAMDALGYYWSDSTSSGRGNRLHGYPSQGALLSREQENEANQVGVAKALEEKEAPQQTLYALPGMMRYPINTLEQAQQALHEASGRAEEQNVKDAIYRAYPELQEDGEPLEDDTINGLIEYGKMLVALACSVQKSGLKKHDKDNLENLRQSLNMFLQEEEDEGEEHGDDEEVEVHKSDSTKRVASVAVRHGNHILMGRRRDNGKWTLPGGHVNLHETMLEGAHRELHEETGIQAKHHNISKLTDIHSRKSRGKDLDVQGFQVNLPEKPKTSMKEDPEAEVHKWHWVDVSKGLPEHIHTNLHVPMKHNVVLNALGIKGRDKVKKHFDSRIVDIKKADSQKQIVYCVVLAPDEVDTQDDYITPEDIEDAAHLYMRKARVIGSNHSKQIDAEPVESYLAPQDMNWDDGPYGPQVVKKGSWVLGIKIHDPKEWQKVLDGDYQGVSVGGFGLRD